MDDTFLEFEKEIMKSFLGGDDPALEILRNQYEKITVINREFTGTGFFTNFSVPVERAIQLEQKKTIAISDVVAQLNDVSHGAGFVLFIKNGYLNCLEGFTYDEDWPDSIKEYKISYLIGEPSSKLSENRDLNALRKELETSNKS